MVYAAEDGAEQSSQLLMSMSCDLGVIADKMMLGVDSCIFLIIIVE